MPSGPRVRSTQSRAIRLTSSAKVSVDDDEGVAVGAQDRIADQPARATALISAAQTQAHPEVAAEGHHRERRGVAADAPEAELGERQQAGEAVDQIERRRRDREDQRRDADADDVVRRCEPAAGRRASAAAAMRASERASSDPHAAALEQAVGPQEQHDDHDHEDRAFLPDDLEEAADPALDQAEARSRPRWRPGCCPARR